jgi:hypothetical protein
VTATGRGTRPAGTISAIALLVVCWLASPVTAGGQVLLTGETGGSGAQAVATAVNLISVKDFSTLTNFWAQYGYGVSDRVDTFAAYGNISVFGETQHYVSVGSNVGILHRGRRGLDVSFYNNAAVAVTRRDEAAAVLLTLALVASRPVTHGSLVVTPYAGLEAVVPEGHRARGVFTPIDTLYAGIAGVAVLIHKNWTAFAECNPGPTLRSAGVGLAATLPRRQPRTPSGEVRK